MFNRIKNEIFKKILLRIVLAVVVTSLVSCSLPNHSFSDVVIDKEHSAEYALDWEGSYQGVIPCASCPGIMMTVTLNETLSKKNKLLFIKLIKKQNNI